MNLGLIRCSIKQPAHRFELKLEDVMKVENNEIRIEIPEGMEIDKENSTLECIKLKPKKLTYDDVAKNLFAYNKTFYFCLEGGIKNNISAGESYADPNNTVSKKQAEKILALNKLINVAKYLNGDWKPVFDDNSYKCWLCLSGAKIIICRDCNSTSNYGAPYFKSTKLAAQAIEILGEETIKLALSQV